MTHNPDALTHRQLHTCYTQMHLETNTDVWRHTLIDTADTQHPHNHIHILTHPDTQVFFMQTHTCKRTHTYIYVDVHKHTYTHTRHSLELSFAHA